MTDYRHELKFLCSVGQKAILRPRLMGLMKPDAHAGPSGRYRVRSLYFDSGHSGYLANENGDEPREKYRIRIYNGSAERIRLERKEKRRGLTRKTSCALSREQCLCLMKGEAPPPKDGDPWLLKNLCALIATGGMAPSVIVEYDRTPYVYPLGNVRITFDENICASDCVSAFLEPELPRRPILAPGRLVLEVKYDELLPDYIHQALQTENLRRTAFSKFYLCARYNLNGGINL